jgi:hypothetical protein
MSLLTKLGIPVSGGAPLLDGSTAAQAAPSTKSLIDLGITTDGVYWIDVPVVGPTQVYCDLSIDSIGWMLMHSNDKDVPVGASPPRSSVADLGRFSAFWQGNAGTNQSFVFAGNILTTATTEKLIKHMPYKKLKLVGGSYTNGMVDFPRDASPATNPTWTQYYGMTAVQAAKTQFNLVQVAANGNTTHAQKMTNTELWSNGYNTKNTVENINRFTYNRTWNDGYNAGEFLLGLFRTSASPYSDFHHVFLGGRADRKSLSSALWRNRNPYQGQSYPLHDSPTQIQCSLGFSGHRGGGNYAHDSWWIQQE